MSYPPLIVGLRLDATPDAGCDGRHMNVDGQQSWSPSDRKPTSADWRAGLERAILAGMAYEYRVTEAEDGTFPVELWSSKGGRETLVYKTPGFQTRELAEAWIVPVE